MLAQDIDAETLFRDTRLEGAPLPVDRLGPPEEHVEELAPAAAAPGRARDEAARRLLRRAERVAGLGNVVRSALLRCARPESPLRGWPMKPASRPRPISIASFIACCRHWRFAQSDPRPGARRCWTLLARTAGGVWSAEARLLYDLQKVCVDYERDIYTVDLVEWALSRGRKPIQRPLPSQREVLMAKHLHSAARRLAAVRIPEARRRQLSALLDAAAARAEEQLRDRFRPLIAAALDDVGLSAANLPERVAQKKLVEELLDRVVHRGFLRMGDLRDALSRNNLKLPDFAGFRDFLGGDQLLRIDRRLGTLLDGVYEPGEVYLRWMQQLSSLAFGTRIGRFVTKFVAIPFGGAFVVLEFVQHVIKMIPGAIRHPVQDTVAGDVLETAHHAVHRLDHVNATQNVLGLGLIILLLIHVGWFRRLVVSTLRLVGRVARHVLIDFPRWLYRQPVVQALVRQQAVCALLAVCRQAACLHGPDRSVHPAGANQAVDAGWQRRGRVPDDQSVTQLSPWAAGAGGARRLARAGLASHSAYGF